jgi:hypothetical protein
MPLVFNKIKHIVYMAHFLKIHHKDNARLSVTLWNSETQIPHYLLSHHHQFYCDFLYNAVLQSGDDPKTTEVYLPLEVHPHEVTTSVHIMRYGRPVNNPFL